MYVYIYIYTVLFFFPYWVTPDGPPVSSTNDAVERLSSFRHFSSKKLQEEASLCLCTHKILPICVVVS